MLWASPSSPSLPASGAFTPYPGGLRSKEILIFPFQGWWGGGETNTRMPYIALKIKNTSSAFKDRHQLVLNLMHLITLNTLFSALGYRKLVVREPFTKKKKKPSAKRMQWHLQVQSSSLIFRDLLGEGGGRTHRTGHAPYVAFLRRCLHHTVSLCQIAILHPKCKQLERAFRFYSNRHMVCLSCCCLSWNILSETKHAIFSFNDPFPLPCCGKCILCHKPVQR